MFHTFHHLPYSLLAPKAKPTESVKHEEYHHITTTGNLVHSHSRRLPRDKLHLARDNFRAMEHMGIVCCSNSPWASPLYMVSKQSGGSPTSITLGIMMPPGQIATQCHMCRTFSQSSWARVFFFQNRSGAWLPPDPSPPRRCAKTAIIMPLGLFESIHLFRSKECSSGISTANGQGRCALEWSSFLFTSTLS